ncbi:polysaccharide deacetylase family protein [Streptomyces odonnellii]|uniref:polysaccharide deacetylase family protein n=1 Tax=Streptomyces odonnellii TaxID=1417980 RepID=UPI00099B7712|nr:polysaccharide deacetylase family protein [Streptomyces odonnellii]
MSDRIRARAAQAAWSLVRRTEALRLRAGGGGRRLLASGPLFGVPADGPGPAGPLPVALTVDDGPHPEWTPRLLDVLEAHEVRATFFVIGAEAARHPELLRRVLAAGHTIGNHSFRHPQPFAALPPETIVQEIRRTQQVVSDETGFTPVLFRAPAGGWSRTVLGAARDQGLSPVDWTVDPKDWRSPPAARIARTVRRARGGDIVLCHDGGGDRSGTVAALDTALAGLRSRGVGFAPL